MNIFLKNEINANGYTFDTFIKKIKNKCSIDTKSKLSKRISGQVKFTEDEISAICDILKKNPCEIFFNRKFLKKKVQSKKFIIDKTKEERT